jgi:hypothetical protein
MGGRGIFRNALLAGGALAATLVGASLALAQEVEGPPAPMNFSDPNSLTTEAPVLDLNVRDDAAVRFSPNANREEPDAERPRRLELELAAGGEDAPVDFAIAQRASLGSDSNGDVDRRGSGSELRVGRGLVGERESGSQRGSSVYMFVASDNEALTWQPGARSQFGGSGDSLAMQERVEVGDMSAGVTYERNGVQASLAYVEREESTQVGNESFSQDTSFAGVTITMRH